MIFYIVHAISEIKPGISIIRKFIILKSHQKFESTRLKSHRKFETNFTNDVINQESHGFSDDLGKITPRLFNKFSNYPRFVRAITEILLNNLG